MMVPNQIKMQSFSPAGRGMYKSNEVDAFMQRIYAGYNELYNENAELKKKFASLRDIIEEYNAGKNAIATALVKAQTVADQTVESAKNAYDAMIADGEKKAKALVDEKTKEAESYAEEIKKKADSYLESVKAELQKATEQTKAESEKYVSEINAKAKEIIENANKKAGEIVANAYGDAKKAEDKKNEIILEAKKELSTVKDEITAFKNDSLDLIKTLLPKLEALSIPEIEIETEDPDDGIPAAVPTEETEPEEELPVFKGAQINISDIGEDRTTVIKEKKEEKKAYVPDADEYVKHIFDTIDIPKSVMNTDESIFEEKKKPAAGVGYNGNKTSFSISDDMDIFSDDDD